MADNTTASAAHHGLHGRSETVLAVTIVMVTISSLFVGFRILSRGAIVKRIMLDDYFILVAWALAVGLSAGVCYSTVYGLGRHEVDIPAEWQRSLRESYYAVSVLYQPALMATKTSILAFYLSLSTADRVFKWACLVTLGVVNAGGLALTFVTAFQCSPVNALFQMVIPANAHCTDILTIYLASVPLNLITDLALLLLPMPILTAMRLPRKQKIILVVTFSAGIFVAVVDVVRISYLQSAAEARLSQIQSSRSSAAAAASSSSATASSLNVSTMEMDTSWYLSYTYLWTAIEVNVGIMCACVPALKPLVARFLPTMLRDPGEHSRFASVSDKGQAARTGAVPDLSAVAVAPLPPPSDQVRSRDFGRSQDSGRSGGGGPGPDGEMGMLDFLTTPDMTELPIQRTTTALTNTSRDTALPTTLFDFVTIKKHKSMVQMTHRESLIPIALVTFLFFIWGFEYGLLNVLNRQFQLVAHVTPGQTTAIHSAYFAGYFLGPLTVGWPVLRHWGFRACFPIGMFIYAGGLLIFWPAAVLSSWPTFVVTNFIVGFGLSLLETACNPFVFLCGPPGYGEIRLNLSQGLQAIGSVVAPLLANRAFFNKSLDTPSLVDTQWAYLGMALATVLLGMIYFYVPLPDATDAEFADADERPDGANQARVGAVQVIWWTLGAAVLAQFFYVGGQEVLATDFSAYLAEATSNGGYYFDPVNFSAIAHTAFAVSRFLAALLGFWVAPRVLLTGSFLGALVFTVLAMRLPSSPAAGSAAGAGVACLIVAFFFEGPIFPLVFAQGLRGLGRHTRLGSVLLTAAISGGAVFAPISSHLAGDASAGTSATAAAFALVAAVAPFAAGSLFPLALMAVRPWREVVRYPSRGRAKNGRVGGEKEKQQHHQRAEGACSSSSPPPASDDSADSRRDWAAGFPRRASRKMVAAVFGGGGGGGKKSSSRDEGPMVEHRERRGSSVVLG